jgi:hypothetical protein
MDVLIHVNEKEEELETQINLDELEYIPELKL